ncbi:MAG: 50S ribosomal protein L15 [Bdellovibrionota bacterium]
MLTLKNLNSPKGAHRNTKRIGRGMGSGQGQTAGKGGKGQTARKSGQTRIGFEGGTMPIYMRLPKRGFKNAPFKTEYAVLNLKKISEHFTNEEVSREILIQKGLLKGQDRMRPVKILGHGTLKSALTFVNLEKFTKSAEEAILKIGGKIINKNN